MGKFRKILKYSVRAVACLIVIAICFYLVIVAINWNDQPPSDLVTETLKEIENRPPIPDKNNAALYLLGFTSPQGVEPITYGIEQRSLSKGQSVFGDGTVSDSGSDFKTRFPLPDHIKATLKQCGEADIGCLTYLKNNINTINSKSYQSLELFTRYNQLIAINEFREATPLTIIAPLPSYSSALNAQKLYFIYTWKLASDGNGELVQEMLEQDIIFWRMVLLNADTLITKMIATAAIRMHFKFGNLILKQLNSDNSDHAIPASWKVAFDINERSLRRAYLREWRLTDKILKELDSKQYLLQDDPSGSLWERILLGLQQPFIQPQASSNQHLKNLIDFVDIYAVDYDQIPNAINDANLMIDSRLDDFYTAYNFYGNILVNIGLYAFESYNVRVSDIEGVRRAAMVVADLRSNGIAENEVEDRLFTHSIREPYRNDPFTWNMENKSVVFTGLESGDRGQHTLLY